MSNQYVGSTPLRGGAGVQQPDDVRLNLSGIGAGVYTGRQSTPGVNNNANNSGGVYYSTGLNSTIGRNDNDNRSIASTPSKISKFTYSGQFYLRVYLNFLGVSNICVVYIFL